MFHHSLSLPARSKGFHLITNDILAAVGILPPSGILHVFIQHTSAGLSIGENADPTVRNDLDHSFDRLAPESDHYTHDAEGPDDMPAHIKAALVGSSISIPIVSGSLALGTWQGIYLCEFREQATARNLVITVSV